MAKLTVKLTNDSNNSQENNNNNNSNSNFSLSTKTDKKIEENTNSNVNENTIQEESKSFELPADNSEFKKLIIEKLDLNNVKFINQEQINSFSNTETNPTIEKINQIILDNSLNSSTLDKIREIITISNKKIEELQAKNTDLLNKEKKQTTLIQNLTTQVEDAEELTFKTEKKYSDTIPISEIIKSFISENFKNESTDRIENLLSDSYKNGGQNGQKFTKSFLKAYVWIENAFLNLKEDEKTNLYLVHNATKTFMHQISGTISSERRPILDIIATLINSHFHEYDFISPEQTLLIDPTIHNAEGTGGSSIKEGLSFAVVRRETRKTVFYADIAIK